MLNAARSQIMLTRTCTYRRAKINKCFIIPKHRDAISDNRLVCFSISFKCSFNPVDPRQTDGGHGSRACIQYNRQFMVIACIYACICTQKYDGACLSLSSLLNFCACNTRCPSWLVLPRNQNMNNKKRYTCGIRWDATNIVYKKKKRVWLLCNHQACTHVLCVYHNTRDRWHGGC